MIRSSLSVAEIYLSEILGRHFLGLFTAVGTGEVAAKAKLGGELETAATHGVDLAWE